MQKQWLISKNYVWIAVGLISSILLVTACAQSAAESPPDQSVPPKTLEALDDASMEESARIEGGELMFYTSLNIDDLEHILAEFKRAYPFINASYYRASGDDVIRKAMTESQAGKHFVDVYETEAFEIYRLMEVNLLSPFIAPESSAYPTEAKDPAGFWTVDRINTVVIAYNTDLVATSDVPTTWEDLLDPKWKGKIGVEMSDVELLADMAVYWGEEKAYSLWEGIAAQNPGLVDGHTELAELVAAGEFAISPNLFGYRVERLKSDGGTIDWVRTDPVFAFSQLLAMAADAPHPATARLFINWLLSEDGQDVYRELGRIPGRPGIFPDPPGLIEGLNIVRTVPSLAADYKTYADQWKTIFDLK